MSKTSIQTARSHSSRRAALLGLAGLALVAGGLGSAGCKKAGLKVREAQALEGDTAPEFELADQAGQRVSLDSLLSGGKPAVLVFYRGHW